MVPQFFSQNTVGFLVVPFNEPQNIHLKLRSIFSTMQVKSYSSSETLITHVRVWLPAIIYISLCYDLKFNKKLSRKHLPKKCFGDVPRRVCHQIWQHVLGYWDVWDIGNVPTFRTSCFIYIYIVISQINNFFNC